MKSIILFLLLFASVVLSADAGLPCVLIPGDSVYQPLAQSVAKELRGQVEIVYATAKPGEDFLAGISPGVSTSFFLRPEYVHRPACSEGNPQSIKHSMIVLP